MTETLEHKDIHKMIRGAVEAIKASHETLSRLDAATGDGDHGTTMLRSMTAVEATLDANAEAPLKDLFYKIGWAIMSADGGSTGPLLGSFFMGMSQGIAEHSQLDTAALADVIGAGVAKMQQQSKAQIGDRTMMDALLPAAAALHQAKDSGASIRQMLKAASEAACQGAEATQTMTAKFGRARNLGDRVLGHCDPGAVSISLIFQGFFDSMQR